MAGQGEDGRRGELLAPICAHLLAHGLDRSGLRELAAAAGTSDRMLLYYFRDKADLMAAAMERLAEALTAQLDAARAPAPLSEAALADRLVGMVLDDGVWPFMQLWLEIAAKGARGDPIFRETGGGSRPVSSTGSRRSRTPRPKHGGAPSRRGSCRCWTG